MNFLERRSQSRQLESAIAKARELTASARAELQASQLQHYGNLALRIDDVLDRLYVPNVRNGVVTIPKKYRESDALPAVTLGRTKRLTLGAGFSEMNPRQQASITDQLAAQGHTSSTAETIAGSLNSIMRDNPQLRQQRSLAESGGADAAVLGISGNFTAIRHEDSSYRWGNRPLLVIGEQQADNPYRGVNLLHECVHLVQAETSPLIQGDSSNHQARNELEAYHASSTSEPAAVERIIIPSIHTTVEMVRERVADATDPFAPQPVLDYGLVHVSQALLPDHYYLPTSN